jgi:outer membrane protein OmpA-like peptidoglycan-associated protein
VQLDSLKGGTKDIDLTLLDDLVRETEDQTVIKMDKFYFNKNKADITPEIATELDKVVRAVALFPDLQLRIESHTDSRGGSATNFRLSQNRADAIRDYLLGQGVPSSNILYSIGFGEDKIINNCTNGVYCLDILHKQNERQLIVVLNYDLLYE